MLAWGVGEKELSDNSEVSVPGEVQGDSGNPKASELKRGEGGGPNILFSKAIFPPATNQGEMFVSRL